MCIRDSICTISLVLYVYKYQAAFESYNSTIALAFLLILVVGIIFSLGSLAHTMLTGSTFNRHSRKQTMAKLEEINEFIIDSNKKLSKFEKALPNNTISISPKGLNCLGLARSITSSLEDRICDAERLLFTKNSVDLIDACELLEQKIQPGSNRMDSLLDAEEADPIEMEDVEEAINNLIEQIKEESSSNIKKAA